MKSGFLNAGPTVFKSAHLDKLFTLIPISVGNFGRDGDRSFFRGQSTNNRMPNTQLQSNDDRRDMTTFPKIASNGRSTAGQYQSVIDRDSEQDVALDQRVSNHLEAGRNRRKIQAQMQGSSLALDPVPPGV